MMVLAMRRTVFEPPEREPLGGRAHRRLRARRRADRGRQEGRRHDRQRGPRGGRRRPCFEASAAPRARSRDPLLSYTIAVGVKGTCSPRSARPRVPRRPGPILAYPYGDGQVRFCIDLPVGAGQGQDAIVAATDEGLRALRPLALARGLGSRHSRPSRSRPAPRTPSAPTPARRPGVVLMGDAAGCAHPLTASGMTNALERRARASRRSSPPGADGRGARALPAPPLRLHPHARALHRRAVRGVPRRTTPARSRLRPASSATGTARSARRRVDGHPLG